jgi:hypothetical protein
LSVVAGSLLAARKSKGVDVVAAVAELADLVDRLADVDASCLPDSVALEQVVELRRQIDRLEAVWSARVAAVHRSGAAGVAGFAGTAAFLRHACRVSPGPARARVDVALQGAERPEVAACFADGVISYPHAKAITEALAPLPEALRGDAEPVLLEAARHFDPARVHQVARRLRHIIDPDGQAGVDERHREDRWVELPIGFRGVGMLRGALDPESAATVRAAIEALATPAGPTDERSAAQRRADALVEMARRTLDSGNLGEAGGERPHITITVPLASLTGASRVPADLEPASGPLGPQTLRRLACDAILTRIITSEPREQVKQPLPRGYLDALPPPLRGPSQVLDVGRSARTANAAIRKALAARDKGCVMPGCDRPPPRCEAHHVVHWADGGATAMSNMALLCAFHHHYVHEHHWHIHIDNDGQVTVTRPQARVA